MSKVKYSPSEELRRHLKDAVRRFQSLQAIERAVDDLLDFSKEHEQK